ncbi:O-antigen polysaccharide polymerase Wzy [bacterium]|nr:O-antigen polysaccharide polymerase Wzy [bacterium]
MSALIAVPVILLLLQIGGRSTIVYFVVFVAVLYSEGHKRIRGSAVVFGLVVGIALAQFYNLARYFLAEGILTSVSETAKIVMQHPEAVLPTSANEFRAPHTSLMEALAYYPDARYWGLSYAAGLVNAVPVLPSILNMDLLNISRVRLEFIDPLLLSEGGGLGFSPVAEGYLNFGILGVWLHMFCYGVLGAWVFRKSRETSSLGWLLIAAGVMPILCFDGLRIHFASAIYKCLRVYLMPVFVYLFIRLSLKSAGTRRRGPRQQDHLQRSTKSREDNLGASEPGAS